MQAAAPAIEVAECLVRGARVHELAAALGGGGGVQRFVEVELLGRRHPVGAEVAVVDELDLHAGQVATGGLAHDPPDPNTRGERGDPQERLGLALAHRGQLVERRVPDPDTRIDAADLDLAELRVVELAPRRERATSVLVLVPPRELDDVRARDALVVLDELGRTLHPESLEQVPQLDHVGEGATLVVGEVGEVTTQRLVGLVEELVVTRHRGVPGVLGHPRLDLAVDREILGIHLGVGRVAERADQHAAERVEVEPGEDLGVRGDELDHAARLGLAGGERPGADLLVPGRPRPREVAVEIDRVVAEEERRGDPLAIEVLDQALGVQLVERTLVLERPLDQQAGELARDGELAARILDAHRERETVTIHVAESPAGAALIDALVARHRADRAPRPQHRLGAIRRDPRHHVEQHLAEPVRDRQREIVIVRDGIEVQPEHVLGDRERHAGPCQLGGVHVAVDPRGRAEPIRLGPDRQEPDVTSLGSACDRGHAAQRGVGLGPASELGGQALVIEVGTSKPQREIGQARLHW